MINTHSNSLPYINTVPDKLPLTTLAFPVQSASLNFSFSELLFDFSALVISIERTRDELIVKAKIHDYAKLILVLQGQTTQDNAYFLTKNGYLTLKLEYESAEVDFVANSLIAIFALAGKSSVTLSSINLDLHLCFDLPPKQISELLKKRHIAYQLMVIENTTGKTFLLPKDYSSKDIENITFVYKAITEKYFSWHQAEVQIFVPATTEQLAKLSLTPIETRAFEPIECQKDVLNQCLFLGMRTTTLKDAVLKNFDSVKKEVAQNDGHLVDAVFISSVGEAIFEFSDAPKLPKSPWSSFIQDLISLENNLCDLLFEKYNKLAEASLSGLSEKEKQAIHPRKDQMELT